MRSVYCNSHDNEVKQASLDKIRDSGVVPGQTYKHFKTGGVYLVTAVGLNESDLEPLVHYRDAEDPYAIVWTRQLHVFTGKALDGVTLVTRFERVG